jgi:hypothetical protein
MRYLAACLDRRAVFLVPACLKAAGFCVNDREGHIFAGLLIKEL